MTGQSNNQNLPEYSGTPLDEPNGQDVGEPADRLPGETGLDTTTIKVTIPDTDTDLANDPKPVRNLMRLAIVVEGGLGALAILLGWLGVCDINQPLENVLSSTVLQSALIWGLLATIPLLGFLLMILKSRLGVFCELRMTVKRDLAPFFQDWTWQGFLVLAIMAGLFEELLFRWALQGGLGIWLGGGAGTVWAAVLIGLLFGLCHMVSLTYGWVTAVIGIYLGLIMIWSGTWLAPAFAHAFYDFVALIAIQRMANRSDRPLGPFRPLKGQAT